MKACRPSLTYTAQVVGDDIVFDGRRVSPRGMTVAIAGDGRNAWRDLSIRLPGERGWRSASRCRRDAQRAAQTPAPSPAQSMQAAAEAMSDALQTALALVELACPATLLDLGDRRVPKARRLDDVLGEDCAFDDPGEGTRARA